MCVREREGERVRECGRGGSRPTSSATAAAAPWAELGRDFSRSRVRRFFSPKRKKILEHNFYPIMSQPSLFHHLIMESLDSAASLPRSSSSSRLLRLSVFSFEAG